MVLLFRSLIRPQQKSLHLTDYISHAHMHISIGLHCIADMSLCIFFSPTLATMKNSGAGNQLKCPSDWLQWMNNSAKPSKVIIMIKLQNDMSITYLPISTTNPIIKLPSTWINEITQQRDRALTQITILLCCVVVFHWTISCRGGAFNMFSALLLP